MEWRLKQPKHDYLPWDDIESKLCSIYGIQDKEEWLRPTEDVCHSPYKLDNIQEACSRIVGAIVNKQNIAVMADVDVDGVCGASIMIRYLRDHGADVNYFSPQRSDGHGLENALDKFPKGTELLIIVDSSTNSIDACKKLHDNGVDIIILDHHHQERKNPYCILVNNQTCDYPNKELSGAGVVYKTVQVLDELLGSDFASQYIDLAGVGIHADMMSVLEPENRYFIYQALKNLTNPGLQAIKKVAGIFDFNAKAIGYNITPIINASSRMGRIELVLELLLEDDEIRCLELAKEIKKLNEDRKKLQKKYLDSVQDQINEEDKLIVVITEDIDKGFNGLVATELSTKFKRPALVVKKEKGMLGGSARTYGGLKLKSFLEKSKCFTELAGHEGAFGVSFSEKYLGKIMEYANKNLDNSFAEQELVYDVELNYDEIDEEVIQTLRRWTYIVGKDFPGIKVLIKNVPIEDKIVSKNRDTVKLLAENLIFVKFKTNEEYAEECLDETIDVIGEIGINKWWHNGLKQLQVEKQVVIDDYKIR